MATSLSIRSSRLIALLTATFFASTSACSSDSDDSKAEGGGGSSGSQSSGGTSTGGSSGASSGGSSGTDSSGGKSSGGSAGSSVGGTGVSVGPGKPVAPTCQVTPGTAPSESWTNVTGNLAGMQSECGNLTLVAADDCSSRVIAGVARAGLWASEGDGTWTALGSGSGSAEIVNRPSSIVFDPEDPDVFYESGIYGNGGDGLYMTTDGGETFVQMGPGVGHNDCVSVDFHDPDRMTVLAGAHEQKQRLHLSRDGGETFTDIGPNIPAEANFSLSPLILDHDTFLLGACGFGEGTCGVLRTLDGGDTWSFTNNDSPEGRPLWSLAGDIYWTMVLNQGMIIGDGAGENWSKVSGPHTGYPTELPDGRVVAVGNGSLIISSDRGQTWTNVGEALPYAAAGVTYSASAKAFYIWRWDCGTVVLPDAVMRAGFDWEG